MRAPALALAVALCALSGPARAEEASPGFFGLLWKNLVAGWNNPAYAATAPVDQALALAPDESRVWVYRRGASGEMEPVAPEMINPPWPSEDAAPEQWPQHPPAYQDVPGGYQYGQISPDWRVIPEPQPWPAQPAPWQAPPPNVWAETQEAPHRHAPPEWRAPPPYPQPIHPSGFCHDGYQPWLLAPCDWPGARP